MILTFQTVSKNLWNIPQDAFRHAAFDGRVTSKKPGGFYQVGCSWFSLVTCGRKKGQGDFTPLALWSGFWLGCVGLGRGYSAFWAATNFSSQWMV